MFWVYLFQFLWFAVMVTIIFGLIVFFNVKVSSFLVCLTPLFFLWALVVGLFFVIFVSFLFLFFSLFFLFWVVWVIFYVLIWFLMVFFFFLVCGFVFLWFWLENLFSVLSETCRTSNMKWSLITRILCILLVYIHKVKYILFSVKHCNYLSNTLFHYDNTFRPTDRH